jgi:glycosyltransferase involved in cell wall biosynthesis
MAAGPLRILHLDSGRTMGGGQWQVLRLIEGLTADGVESTLLARKGSPLFAAAEQKGWRVEPISLFRAVRKYDLVHAHDARGHMLAALAGAAPLVVARRVAFPIHSSAASRWKYSKATHYIAVSEFVRGILVDAGVIREKISVVYDGVPLQPVSDQPRAGVVSPANKSMPVQRLDVKLSTNLEHDVPRAAVFLYISESEGLGSAILLAMSAGTPVVASKIGGIPEIIRHGENGLLVENDWSAVSAAVHTLLVARGLAPRLAAAGRQTIAERFTLDQMVRNTMEVYHRVLGC